MLPRPIGLVSTSTWLMNGITSAVSAGFSVQVAHHIGAGKEDEARNVVRNGMVAALIVSGLLCLTGVGLSPHLPGWLGGAQEIRADASAYFMVFALMVPFSQLNSLCSAFLQCSGDMVTPSVLERGDVPVGRGVQRDFHSALWRDGRRHRHGGRLRGGQPADGSKLLPAEQDAAPDRAEGKRAVPWGRS